MRLSDKWLREWVDPPLDAAALAEQLTMAGLEVDSIERVTAPFSGVVVARVLEVSPHPRAAGLSVCRIDAGSGPPVTVLCGAPDVRPGIAAAFAPAGATLPGGRRIERATLHGVDSEGMLCSEAELGLGETAERLLLLPAETPAGLPLERHLDLDDHVLDIDPTPNRGDCLSVLGLAREVAVMNRLSAPVAPIRAQAAVIDDRVPVALADPSGCPVYAGRVIRGVDARAPTPGWLRERLRRAGLRSLGAVVDVTNYVMLETGQPLHAFDLSTLVGGIVVRRAHAGERIRLLDGRELEPGPQTLVIADAERPVALAGIMGGAETAVSEHTTDVFLEGAFFDPVTVARRARALHLATDAAQRFERGVAFDLQARAIERATELLLAVCGGRAGPVAQARDEVSLPRRRPVRLRRRRLEDVLGWTVAPEEVTRILSGLGLSVEADPDGWRATPPAHRFDLAIEADLIEEVARIAGYDALPARLPQVPMAVPPVSERRIPAARARAVLVERGYQEVITYSFVDPGLLALLEPGRPGLALANPISTELSVMRTGMWASLLETAGYNVKRQRDRVRLFEIGPVFAPRDGSAEETTMIGGVALGPAAPRQWALPARPLDFFDVKGDVEALLTLARAPAAVEVRRIEHPALHPGQAAEVLLRGKSVGRLGALHPALQARLELPGPVFVFELELAALCTAEPLAYRAISRFPAIRRDLAVVVDRTLPAAALLAATRALAGELLVDLELFDVYEGEGIDSGKKSLAMGLIFQGSSSTLTDEQVDAAMEAVLRGLAERYGAGLRS